MKVESVDNQILGIGADLVMLLLMAMDIYYETTQAITKEKKISGTINPIITKQFKGKGFFIKEYDNDISNLVTITKVEVSSFGVELSLENVKEKINICYDGLKLAIKNS